MIVSEITDLHLMAPLDFTRVRAQSFGTDLGRASQKRADQRGFAGAVASDQSDFFSP